MDIRKREFLVAKYEKWKAGLDFNVKDNDISLITFLDAHKYLNHFLITKDFEKEDSE
jgi:hypothetical protein